MVLFRVACPEYIQVGHNSNNRQINIQENATQDLHHSKNASTSCKLMETSVMNPLIFMDLVVRSTAYRNGVVSILNPRQIMRHGWIMNH